MVKINGLANQVVRINSLANQVVRMDGLSNQMVRINDLANYDDNLFVDKTPTARKKLTPISISEKHINHNDQISLFKKIITHTLMTMCNKQLTMFIHIHRHLHTHTHIYVYIRLYLFRIEK